MVVSNVSYFSPLPGPGEMIQVDYFSKQNRIYEAHRGNVLVLVGTAMSADLSCPLDPLPESRAAGTLMAVRR